MVDQRIEAQERRIQMLYNEIGRVQAEIIKQTDEAAEKAEEIEHEQVEWKLRLTQPL